MSRARTPWPRAALCVATALASLGAAAHHGSSAYDMSEPIRLEGRVVEWRWSSPHTWLVFDADGRRWRIEGGPPAPMARQGWSADTLAPGETVEIVISPARREADAGILRQLHKPGGTSFLIRRPGYVG